jgi:hypothetical protein
MDKKQGFAALKKPVICGKYFKEPPPLTASLLVSLLQPPFCRNID